jgi:hypothetical protein
MALTREQLEHVVAAALPGDVLREHLPLGHDRVRLTLASGEALDLHAFNDRVAAANAVAALRRLRGEIDLPIPALRASDPSGELAGVPCLLASPLDGESLLLALPRIPEEQLHLLGQRIGEIAYRVHRLACPNYGQLASSGNEAGPTDERAYVLARLALDLPNAHAQELLDVDQIAQIQEWFEIRFQPIGTVATLVIGGLELGNLLVRNSREGWAFTGMLGWEQSLGWSACWDHTVFLESARHPRCFGLRVGYGKAYDELTPRTYEQVREGVLRPYRMLLALHQMLETSEVHEWQRHRRVLLALLGLAA